MVVATSHIWFWQTPSWGWAEFWALVILAIPSLIAFIAKRLLNKQRASLFFGLISGVDGRWSTSKAGVVMWTYAVWFAFLAILLHTSGTGLAHAVLHQQYLILLGIPAASAVIAKGVTQSKVETGALSSKTPRAPETDPIAGIGQLVADDSGKADLGDFQYVGFNLILLGYFFLRFLGHEALGLPSLPDTLVALSGVSGAAYVSKKGLEKDAPPRVTAVVPRLAAPGETFTVRGVNLASATDPNVSVMVGGLAAQVTNVIVGDADTRIDAVVPSDATPGPSWIGVVNYQGADVTPADFVVRQPK